MFGILDRYVGKNVSVMIVLVLICLTFLMTLIKLIDHLRYIGRGTIDFYFVLEYTAYQIPGIMVLFFPVCVLIGGVIGLGTLARTSEIVVMQSVGRSKFGIIGSALKTMIPVMLVVLAIGELMVPKLEQRAELRYQEEAKAGQLTVTHNGLWLREGDDFIGIGNVTSDGVIHHVVRYEISDGEVSGFSAAESGHYEDGKWIMQKVIKSRFVTGQVFAERVDTEIWALNLTPDRVDVVGVKGLFLTASDLIDYIHYLEENHQNADKQRLELYSKFWTPITVTVMLLLAASTVFGPLRSMTMGARVLAGIALGFCFYVVNQIVAPSSLIYGIPPMIGATMPSIIFGALAMWLLHRQS